MDKYSCKICSNVSDGASHPSCLHCSKCYVDKLFHPSRCDTCVRIFGEATASKDSELRKKARGDFTAWIRRIAKARGKIEKLKAAHKLIWGNKKEREDFFPAWDKACDEFGIGEPLRPSVESSPKAGGSGIKPPGKSLKSGKSLPKNSPQPPLNLKSSSSVVPPSPSPALSVPVENIPLPTAPPVTKGSLKQIPHPILFPGTPVSSSGFISLIKPKRITDVPPKPTPLKSKPSGSSALPRGDVPPLVLLSSTSRRSPVKNSPPRTLPRSRSASREPSKSPPGDSSASSRSSRNSSSSSSSASSRERANDKFKKEIREELDSKLDEKFEHLSRRLLFALSQDRDSLREVSYIFFGYD